MSRIGFTMGKNKLLNYIMSLLAALSVVARRKFQNGGDERKLWKSCYIYGFGKLLFLFKIYF
jgi:hypothetical protein